MLGNDIVLVPCGVDGVHKLVCQNSVSLLVLNVSAYCIVEFTGLMI